MGIFYPGNSDRHDRAVQLISNIAFFQNQIQEDISNAKKRSDKLNMILSEVAKTKGYKSVDELIKQSKANWSKEIQEAYEKAVAQTQEFEEEIKRDMSYVGYFATVCSGVATSAKVVEVVRCGHAAVVFKAVGYGVLEILSGNLKAGTKLMSLALKSAEGLGKIGKVAKIFKSAGKILTWLGIAIDIFLLPIEIITEKNQAEDLEHLIHDLDVRRFVAKSAQLSFAEYTTHLSNMQSVANLDEITKGLDEASKKRVIENSAKQAAKDAKEMQAFSNERVWNALEGLDATQHATWKVLKQWDLHEEEVVKRASADTIKFEFDINKKPKKPKASYTADASAVPLILLPHAIQAVP